MKAPGLALVGALSALPLVAESLSGGALAIEGASRLGLCALPWLALAGLPRSSAGEDAAVAAPTTHGLVPLAIALPVLGLATGLDRASSVQPDGSGLELLGRLAVVGALIGLWGLAAARSAGRAGGPYPVLWWILVPASAALVAALTWVPLDGSGTRSGAGLLGCLNPLVWAFRWTSGGSGSLGGATLALGSALAVLGFARQGRPDPEEGEPR